jgi:ribose 5-phosphate isomerase B
MRVAIAADHGGYELKQHVKRWLAEHGHVVADFGTDSTQSVDYPDYGFAAAEAVAHGEADAGVLCCTTGIGMSITANKVPGIRAALVADADLARNSRTHNDANVLCLAGKRTDPQTADAILETWFSTAFEGGRHARRVEKIAAKERECREC